jgi:Lrp/AsnC family leucine-responsive transcriptional regulator
MMVFVEVLLDRTTPNVFEQFKAAVQAQEADPGVPHGGRRF